MHMVVGDAPSLGLKLQGKFALHEGEWRRTDFQYTAWGNTKATTKIVDRMRIFHNHANSVITKSSAFSMYIFSTMPCFSSYHGSTAQDVHRLQGLAQTLVLGRAWLKRNMVAHIFRYLRVAPLFDPAISLTLATIELHLRRGGSELALLPGFVPTSDRNMTILREIWCPWFQIALPSEIAAVVAMDSLVHANITVRKQFGGFAIRSNNCYSSLSSHMPNLI